MARTVELSGRLLVYLFYAVSLAIVPVLAYFIVWPLDDVGSVFLTALLVGLVFVAMADLWYWRSGAAGEHLSTAAKRNLYDITYDPFGDPGQAAKDSWRKALRRTDTEDEEE